ncbi:MAG: phenylalanine--tRNA ligase subunit beta [Candidatus Coatesbacteria bacterium]|nr:MAG: phenylalanine--tRNA ligase subunit beta [Candidatus Coatesbacteria bacterium]
MKYSFQWLSDYCPITVSAERLAEELTRVGFEVEAMDRRGADVIFNVDVVPVRSDCLSMIGLAREIATFIGAPLTLPPVQFKEVHIPKEFSVKVELVDQDLCPRYSGRVITDLKVGPSPPWLAERLEAVGVRAVNNVVDITNFINLERGQPLHAFDLAKLRGRTILIRRAQAGEKLTLLDGQELELSTEDLVIADGEGPVALAGVMGGGESEVSPSTEAILLESAHFDAVSVRRTARRYGLATESSYRFERGTDPTATLEAADRAAALMAELADGTVLGPPVDAGQTEWARPAIVLRPARANMLLGTALTGEDMAVLLRRLYFDVGLDRMENLIISAPSFRRDVSSEIDVVEEVARAYGYNNVEATLPAGRFPAPRRNPREEFEREARYLLTAAGFHEVYTPSFTNPRDLEAAGWEAGGGVPVANPTVSQFSHLRPALWPALAEVAERNGRLGAPSVMIFELGTTFAPGEDGAVVERLHLAALAAGETAPRSWSGSPPFADFYFVKGLIEAFARERELAVTWDGDLFRVGEAEGKYRAAPLEPFGEAHIVELDVTGLVDTAPPPHRYEPVSRFPSVVRDLALVLPEEAPAGAVAEAVRASSDLAREASIFDLFTGEGVPPGHKSVGVRVRYQADDRTLTDDEVNAAREQAVQAVAAQFGAALRE